MKRSIGTWQMAGFIFTGITGTLLHFLYDWSGESPVVGLFSAVNESIWEHMKLLFFPMLIFSFIEYIKVGKAYTNFRCVKALGTGVGLATIPALYYTYTGALGLSVDWFNIAIFFIAAAVVYYLEAKLLIKGQPVCPFPGIAVAFLVLMAAAFMVLTYYPLQIPLFLPPA